MQETDLRNLREHKQNTQLPDFLLQPFEEIAINEDYIEYEIHCSNVSFGPLQITATLYTVDINGETKKGKKETNIFVKRLIPHEHITMVSIKNCFLKESYFYKKFSKLLNEIQNEAKIPVGDRFKIPKSYDVTNDEVIFMENLAIKGLTSLKMKDVMSFKFAELSVKELAKFHGLSYVLQIKRPGYFEKYLKNKKTVFIFNEEWKNYVKKYSDTWSENLDDNSKEKIEKFLPNFFYKFPDYTQNTILPGSTIVHGDFTMQNILMKQTDGVVSDVTIIDYQLYYYGCPLNDFFFLICNGSDQEFRKNHLTDLKNLYYDYLEEFLCYFNLKINEIYPRNEFERQYKKRLDLMLMFALYCIPIQFASQNHGADILESDLTSKNMVLDEGFRERIQGFVDDFTQWGYL